MSTTLVDAAEDLIKLIEASIIAGTLDEINEALKKVITDWKVKHPLIVSEDHSIKAIPNGIGNVDLVLSNGLRMLLDEADEERARV